jgi:hypothetical protein
MFGARKDGLDRPETHTAGSSDDADGTDAIFSTRTHRDLPRSISAFAREGNLDPDRPQESLRPPQATGERTKITLR